MNSQKLVALTLLVVMAGRSAPGQQCAPSVPLGAGALGADNTVAAMTEWDPDGAGPLGPRWVLGGTFGTAGNVLSPGMAAFDPATGQWSGFGAGGADVRALLALPNGQLLAAGDFAATLGPAGARLALWNGTAWQALGSGVDGQVAAMARLPNGDLVVGGRFATAGGTPCSNIARWDGATWNSLGTGIPGPGPFENYTPVRALTVDPAGTLWVGGDFASAGGVPCANIARWNGTTWSPVGPGLTAAVASQTSVRGVTGLGVLPSGQVAAIGPFDTSGASSFGAPLGGAARWNGVFWERIGGGIGSLSSPSSNSMLPLGMSVAPNGEIVVVGQRLAGTRRMLRWNLSQWQELPSATDQNAIPLCALFSGGELLVGGYFKQLGTPPVRIDHVARLVGASWQPLPSPSVGISCDETWLGFGDYQGQPIATGRIGFVGNQPANGLIVRQGGTWQRLPGTPSSLSGYAVASLGNGDLVVGGAYFDLGGTVVPGLVRYDGFTWSAFGGFSGWFGWVRSLLRLRDGSLVIGGNFETVGGVLCNGIARWDGATWSSFGTGVEGAVLTLLELPNGDLVAAGTFQVAGGVPCNRVARWNGSTWSPFGSGIGGFEGEVQHAVLDGSGALVVAGSFAASQQVPGHVARWDGANWSLLAGGVSAPVTGLAALPGGDILVAVANPFAATTSPGLLRTDGTTWTPFAVQPDGGNVLTMHLRPDGELLLRGTFGGVGGVRSSKFASVVPSCPALAVPIGGGCVGSGGASTLTSVELPWLGGVARAEATGLPADAVVLVGLGVTPANLPLAALTPLAQPGCVVRTTFDLYVLAGVSGGSLPIDLALPAVPALVGATLFEQVLSLGWSGGVPVEATSTNALELRLGLFGN